MFVGKADEDWSSNRQQRSASGWQIEALILISALFFVLLCNQSFWSVVLIEERLSRVSGWLFIAALFVSISALHFVLLSIFINRWTLRWLLPILFLATSFAVYFMGRYGVYLDPSMIRNVVATDVGEASDLLAWSMLPYILGFGVLPVFLLSRLNIELLPIRRAFFRRLGWMGLAIVIGVGAVLLVFQEMASTMRNDKALRYLITPANYLYSTARVFAGQARNVDSIIQPVGEDARLGPRMSSAKKPVALVFVLGETVRAANWGLSGYARQTTPQLAQLDVINFGNVTSCGTNTETSVPCMFSAWGRREYNERRIRNSESLLNVVNRAGFRVIWLDNQSGCKGVCRGVEYARPDSPALCKDGECMDEALVESLKATLSETRGNVMVVMHQMGNHGPAYYKRYPEQFKAFEPACALSDLAQCPREHIVNAYDNAILYTDHVVASTVKHLQALDSHSTALIYVSDHGESLGEDGLYLHGIPYMIAPDVQTHVPMLMWLSSDYQKALAVDQGCMKRRAEQPASHDHLFHSVLGMLDISTAAYRPEQDLTRECRSP